jgi:hypothetical protein
MIAFCRFPSRHAYFHLVPTHLSPHKARRRLRVHRASNTQLVLHTLNVFSTPTAAIGAIGGLSIRLGYTIYLQDMAQN